MHPLQSHFRNIIAVEHYITGLRRNGFYICKQVLRKPRLHLKQKSTHIKALQAGYLQKRANEKNPTYFLPLEQYNSIFIKYSFNIPILHPETN